MYDANFADRLSSFRWNQCGWNNQQGNKGVIAAIVLMWFGGKFVWQKIAAPKAVVVQGIPLATQTVNDLTMKTYDQLRTAPSEALIELRDTNNHLVDVGDVKSGRR